MSVLSTAKGAIDFIKEVVVDDFKEHPLDTAPWLNSAVYLGAMLFFGVPFGKAIVIATIILFAIMYHYGRRALIRGGMVALFFTLTVWAEIIPEPSKWGHLVRSIVTAS